MRIPDLLSALPLVIALPACSVAPDERSRPGSTQEAAPLEVPDPMTSFARFVGGEWRFASGGTAAHAWQWGPGRFSMRRMTYAEAASNPWAGEVMYWHPGLGQVCLLSMHEDIPAVGRGLARGTIRFEGEATDAVIDLHQPRGPRKLAQRQVFEDADTYRETLLEDTGAGYQPLAEWTFVRSGELREPQAPAAERARIDPSGPFAGFAALVARTWEADGDPVGENGSRIRSTYEWQPSLEAILIRTVALDGSGESRHLLDAYVYRPVLTEGLRCLALTHRGGVHEGDVTVLDGDAVRLDLESSEGDRTGRQVVELALEKDGDLRTRAWFLEGGVRTLTLDLEQRGLEPGQDGGGRPAVACG